MNVLEITTRIACPVSCTYCPQKRLINAYRKRGGPIMMSLEDFCACIDKVPESVTIGFCGMCEPWANPACTDMLLYAAKKNHKIFIDSTLRGMSMADFEMLCKVDLEFFAVHLPSDGGKELIPITDEYRAILGRIQNRALKAGYVDLTYYGGNLHPDLDIPEARRNVLLTRSGNIDVTERETPPRLVGKLICRRNLRQNHLLPNGDVILCSADYGLEHVIGNLLQQPYESLFESREFQRVENGMSNEKIHTICRKCDSFCRNADLKASIANNWRNLRSIRPEGLPLHMISLARRSACKIRQMMGLPPR